MGAASKRRVAIVVGARPNFVKAAPVLRRLETANFCDVSLVHTGQHYDPEMSALFFAQMGIREPDVTLQTGGEFHTERIGRMFATLTAAFAHGAYDSVLVFGDVNSTLAGAIAATRRRTQLMHVEAGLRSHDRRMPEEINRVIVDHLSDVLFTTEPAANENLRREGIPAERVHYVGNAMIESLEMLLPRIQESGILRSLRLEPHEYVVVTIHRQENTDDPVVLEKLLRIVLDLKKNVKVVFPMHPGTRRKTADAGFGDLIEKLGVSEPLGYLDFMKLVHCAAGVVTDSGGIQEETSHLGVPCCTLRDNTERPVTIELGSNRLFPIQGAAVADMLAHIGRGRRTPRQIPLWDANVSQRIVDVLRAIWS